MNATHDAGMDDTTAAPHTLCTFVDDQPGRLQVIGDLTGTPTMGWIGDARLCHLLRQAVTEWSPFDRWEAEVAGPQNVTITVDVVDGSAVSSVVQMSSDHNLYLSRLAIALFLAEVDAGRVVVRGDDHGMCG